MEETFVPMRGIKNDLRGRLMCYKQDWTGGFRAGYRYPLIFNLSFSVIFRNLFGFCKQTRHVKLSNCRLIDIV